VEVLCHLIDNANTRFYVIVSLDIIWEFFGIISNGGSLEEGIENNPIFLGLAMINTKQSSEMAFIISLQTPESKIKIGQQIL